ncbi:MAG TPA: hypothetical protein DET40_01400 [Lentisphaeria bacterium]|nr:MAG: hypothetical protein A2X45_09350 [Lentisphaerae bacterium GWF2_50_93]HCE42188.1 hypothetical protein [Lentisphaeria bacterium]
MKKIEFQGWKNCVELQSGKFRIVVTTEVGPRIIGAFVGKGENMMCVVPAMAGKKGGRDWKIYGGHRLWHAPEAKPRSYAPDNSPVEAKETKDGLVFTGGVEKSTGIYKSFAIKPLGNNKFRIRHTIRNENPWEVEIAAWALTVMDAGGVAVIPVPQGDKDALLPNRYLTVWPYTNMADGRLTFGDKYILLRQQKDHKYPSKIGLNCEDGWMAYANKGCALVKRFTHLADAEYPDNGCSIETYTCDFMLEIETLSPLYILAPGEEIIHDEEWEGKDGIGEINSEKDAAKYFKN